MVPYSLDLRARMAAACRDPNARRQQIADRFSVSYSFITKLLRSEQQTGSLAAKPASGGRARALSASDQQWVVAYVEQHSDATLSEVKAAWQAHSGRRVGQTCIWQVLDEHQLRRKKKSARHRA